MGQSLNRDIDNAEPVVSVITVVFNGRDTIERTIKSVLAQTYPNVEYIIIDGGSKDGTVEIVKQYQQHIHHFLSEPDNGLYDAMNKGMALASGNYFWFINSGDEIAGVDVLQSVFSVKPWADFYYGDTLIVDNFGREIGPRRLQPPPSLTWKDFRQGMLVSHQSVIVSRNVAGKYDLRYRFSADFDWVLSALKASSNIVNTELILSRFLEGGLTRKNLLSGLKERFAVMKKYYGLPNTLWSHIPIAIKFISFIVKHRRL